MNGMEATREFGQYIQKLRTNRGMGLVEAARATGVHRATLHRWEKGEVQPRLSELEALLTLCEADALQKRQALTLLNAPRARLQLQSEIVQIGERYDLGPLPDGGDLLRAMRLRRGFSLEELAARMGVTPRTLRRWEQAEVWPSSTSLHVLCQTLQAHEEEMTTLTVGRFTPTDNSRSVFPDALREQISALHSQPTSSDEERLRDLRLFAMEARLWPLAAKSTAMRQMLAEVCVLHARLYSYRDQHGEMIAYAQRALGLMSEKQTGETLWLHAAIFAAHAVAVRGGRLMPQRGLDHFRQLLPLARTPDVESWILAWRGELQVAAGAVESGFATMERSCQTAGQCADTVIAQNRRVDYANLLLQVGRFAAAIPLVQFEEVANPYFRIRYAMAAAKAYLGVNDRDAAQRALALVAEDIETFSLPHFQPMVDALTQQL